MPAIPDPSDLLEAARSTQRPIEDREWKQYQRYLRKRNQQQREIARYKQPLTFEEFCDEYQIQEIQQ